MSDEPTLKEKSAECETRKHIMRVQELMLQVVTDLADRAKKHDQSKLEEPEVSMFAAYTERLEGMDYSADPDSDYQKCRQEMLEEDLNPLGHHYAHNDHHPEHFENGINDMSLIQILEMLCDWKAAGERHRGGNIFKSIEENTKRFGLDPQTVAILTNTAKALWPMDGYSIRSGAL